MTDKKITYKVKANEFEFVFTNEDIGKADMVKGSAGVFNLLKERRSLNAKLVAADTTGKKLTIEVEGENYLVEIKDELDQQLEKMGLGLAKGKSIKEIKAPMPGLVLEIAVSNGQQVKDGDKILILEAMKMENSIVIHTDAIVKRIAVTAGQAVEKGQVLVELE